MVARSKAVAAVSLLFPALFTDPEPWLESSGELCQPQPWSTWRGKGRAELVPSTGVRSSVWCSRGVLPTPNPVKQNQSRAQQSLSSTGSSHPNLRLAWDLQGKRVSVPWLAARQTRSS